MKFDNLLSQSECATTKAAQDMWRKEDGGAK